jgi:curved DNA-binding protein CbpA
VGDVSGTRDAYEILQVAPSAVPEVVEAAYHALALLHHPDLGGSSDSSPTMADLNWAYATLRSPEGRTAYDRERVAIPIAPSGSLMERVNEHAAAAVERAPESPGRVVLDFGRYAGMTLSQVARVDLPYLEWLKRHSSGLRYRSQIDALLAGLTARRAEVG